MAQAGLLPDTWYRRDLPVLVAIVRRWDKVRTAFNVAGLRPELGDMPEEELWSAVAALHAAELMEGVPAGGPWIAVRAVYGRAYQVVGMHPDVDDDLDALIEVIRQAAERAADPDEKSRLRKYEKRLLTRPARRSSWRSRRTSPAGCRRHSWLRTAADVPRSRPARAAT